MKATVAENGHESFTQPIDGKKTKHTRRERDERVRHRQDQGGLNADP
jgi:hypothetical protein